MNIEDKIREAQTLIIKALTKAHNVRELIDAASILAELDNAQCDNHYGLKIGDIVEVLNQDGEVRENWGFCGRGDRGRVLRLFAPYVTININGKEGTTRICNVMKIGQ